MWIIKIDGNRVSQTFNSEYNAVQARETCQRLLGLNPHQIEVTPLYPKLKEWTPDEADIYILSALCESRTNVTAIKFIRTKSKADLRQSKDYWDTYFRQIPKIQNEPQNLGDLLRPYL